MTTAQQQQLQPLWPHRIEIIGLTGEFASGKTLFGLTIDPQHTRIYDTEKSAGSYLSLGFDRVDMGAELLKRYPTGYKPKQAFEWWLDSIRRIEPGKFRVIMLDTIGEVESGLTDWVEDNPQHFNHTRNQYDRMAGLFWADVKEHWKLVLNDLASRCETFVFTAHMGNVWDGGAAPVKGKRKPKGKETLMELASLYLQLERKPDDKGAVPAIPSAIVLKSRLASMRLNKEAGGEVEVLPTLPPRLPFATPKAIREYMVKPPDYAKLKKDERVQEQRMSEDDRLQLQAQIAKDNAEAERARTERMGGLAAAATRHEALTAGAPSAMTEQQATTTTLSTNGTHSVNIGTPSTNGTHADDDPATESQLQELARLRNLGARNRNLTTKDMIGGWWSDVMKPFGVASAKALKYATAQALIDQLRQSEDLSFRFGGESPERESAASTASTQ